MPRMNVRQLWKAKLEGRLPASAAEGVRLAPAKATGAEGGLRAMRVPFAGLVLGIDPSLRGTGLALVEFGRGPAPLVLRSRTISVSPRASMAVALAEIHRGVTEFLAHSAVRHVALEQTIFVQNFQTAQILGAARGAAIAAAALRGHEVWEYPPLRVKQAVVGLGRASKEQVARTVMAICGQGSALASDEADAAAVALCHAFTWRE